MERIMDGATAVTHRVVQVTPTQLRQLALRLETMARESALPGEWITCAMTRSITLAYDPGISSTTWRNALVRITENSSELVEKVEDLAVEATTTG